MAKRNGPERMRQRLVDLGLTQRAAADLLGLDPAQVSRILTGERRPTLTVAVAIERELGIPPETWL